MNRRSIALRMAVSYPAVAELRPLVRDVVSRIALRFAGPDEARLREALDVIRTENLR